MTFLVVDGSSISDGVISTSDVAASVSLPGFAGKALWKEESRCEPHDPISLPSA